MKTIVIEEQMDEIIAVAAMLVEQEMAVHRLKALKAKAARQAEVSIVSIYEPGAQCLVGSAGYDETKGTRVKTCGDCRTT